MPETVALWQMLERRERRAARQKELLDQYRRPLVWFTMNIAGPVKDTPLIRRGFALGCRLLDGQLLRAGAKCLYRERCEEVTGCEAAFVVDLPPLALKRLASELEEDSPLGRLFDMDVLAPGGRKVDRQEVGLSERRCLLCGGPARACARSRTHTVEELQKATNALLRRAVDEADARKAAELTCRALLYEVGTTPKPGLVDCCNSGSHRDMDLFTFFDSTAALWPYFADCVRLGRETAELPPEETFARLGAPGRMAENAMFGATKGVNTHKGAVFTLGTLCGALGRLSAADWPNTGRVLQEVAAMAHGLVARDFAGLTRKNARTTGQKLYLDCGLTGVRGQLEEGLPAVGSIGLPALEAGVAAGHSLPEAGCAALLALLAGTVDTNLIARGGRETQQRVAAQVAGLLEKDPYPDRKTLEQLDAQFIGENLSPGGSADLLAASYLLYFLKTEAL